MEQEDACFIDRGFRCEKVFAAKGAQILMPSFTKPGWQLFGEVTQSRELSRVRIHVDPAIKRLRTFRILQTVLPVSYIKENNDFVLTTIEKTLIVCGTLANMRTPPIKKWGYINAFVAIWRYSEANVFHLSSVIELVFYNFSNIPLKRKTVDTLLWLETGSGYKYFCSFYIVVQASQEQCLTVF